MSGARHGEITIGCHLSVAGGFSQMGKTALEIGANTFAFFTRNPRGGKAKTPDPADEKELLSILAEHGFGRLVAHAPYTMNLCSAKPQTVEFAREAMAGDLRLLEDLPGNYYNFHPGSHVGQGVDAGIRLICEGLDQVLVRDQKTTVLLETMAGKGSEVGSRFEELARIINGTRDGDLLGVCLDTCHVADAGYDIVNDLDGVLDEFDRIIGLDRLKALHVNDSKNPLGSHKDRHEKIGEGTLGISTFQAVVTNERLAGLPMILETPNDLEGYAHEIMLLRDLARGDGKY
ncbi:MAG: deoxyribonuclease IV [Olsenella sp.]|jgi:deoxyribonuclease-4|nr:deoxyribonuclease IV [Olsenella sp.]MCI2184032.1 deoxyribonuclease IV [Olsenella sp.]MCI2187488.1 deoxyribonuclease IV [Olsenella sp.]